MVDAEKKGGGVQNRMLKKERETHTFFIFSLCLDALTILLKGHKRKEEQWLSLGRGMCREEKKDISLNTLLHLLDSETWERVFQKKKEHFRIIF